MSAVSEPVAGTQGYTHLRTYRYERKFLVDEMKPYQVKGVIKLHPLMFYSPYSPRYVNNLYLDTPELENYYDNVHGASRRRKVRVRWYGEPFGEIERPILEIKVKDGLVGTKHSFALASFCLDGNFCSRYFLHLAANSALPKNVWLDLRNLDVVLFNRYHRHYYTSRDGRFRVTLDCEMRFYKVNDKFGNRFIHRQENFREAVVELKYEIEQEQHANRVASFFPFRVTRNSKYVQGMERVYF